MRLPTTGQRSQQTIFIKITGIWQPRKNLAAQRAWKKSRPGLDLVKRHRLSGRRVHDAKKWGAFTRECRAHHESLPFERHYKEILVVVCMKLHKFSKGWHENPDQEWPEPKLLPELALCPEKKEVFSSSVRAVRISLERCRLSGASAADLLSKALSTSWRGATSDDERPWKTTHKSSFWLKVAWSYCHQGTKSQSQKISQNYSELFGDLRWGLRPCRMYDVRQSFSSYLRRLPIEYRFNIPQEDIV